MKRRLIRIVRDLPIRKKLVLVTLVTCAAALTLTCSVLFWFQTVTFKQAFVTELESIGAIVAHNSAAPLTFHDSKSAVEVLSALAVKPHITAAWVLDSDNHVFAQFGREAKQKPTLPSPPGNRVAFDEGYASLSLPIELDHARLGQLFLRAQFRDKYRELVSLYSLLMAAVIGGSLLIIVIVSAPLQRLIASPITALAQVSGKIAETEDYSVRAAQKGFDEVGMLTCAFNRMIDQIQARDARLRLINTSLEREIVERKEAEAALRESRERYEIAIAGSNDGIWDWKIEANEMFFSARWKEMLGYTDADLPNAYASFEPLIHPEDRVDTLGALKEYLDNKRPSYELEFRMRHKDGTYRWILSRGAALRDGEGKPLRMAGSHTDITNRKRAQDEVNTLSRRVQEASRMAGMAEVATAILHNVGNVLNSVSVITVTLKDDLEKSKILTLSKTAGLLRENLDQIGSYLSENPKGKMIPDFLIKLSDQLERERGVALCKMKDLLLDVEHIKEIIAMQQSFAKVSGVIEPLIARDLVEDALRIHAGALQHHQIALEKDFDAAPRVMVDRHKVLQILLNVIRNAKYAMDEGPNRPKLLKVRIYRRNLASGAPHRVCIEVKDNGVGIDPDNLTRIFSHGFTTKKDGHGFGLHSAANAAREMGGILTASSPGLGLGATFTLELPICT